MNTTIENVKFTFPGVCPSCQQELADREEENTYSEQNLSLSDILDSGQPLCPECDALIQPEDFCHVDMEEEEIIESCGGQWGEHADHSREDWQAEVRNSDTNLGYWEWVTHRMEVE